MKFYIWTFLFTCAINANAQNIYPKNPLKPTDGEKRMNSSLQRSQLLDASTSQGLEWINIGPTIMGGRVTDIEVDPNDHTHFFVAYASGGLWETKNNGTTFEPVFDNNGYTLTIGDLAVNWKTEEIWVGTGEANSSRSSYAGYGVFYSSDLGNSWQHKGLSESHHIGRMVIDSKDPDIIYAGVLGHLYSANNERGIYRSTDKGHSWEHVLFINANTGVVDLVQDQENPDILYAAAWEKSRRAWNLWESGEKSGIYKSTDRGKTWKKVTGSGFPSGETVGRIGLALYSKDKKSVLYAMLDNQSRHSSGKDVKTLSKNDFIGMKKEAFLAIPDSTLSVFLNENGFPKKYDIQSIRKMVRKNEIVPEDLYRYLTDANAALFEDPVKGAELYRSTDGGATWQKTHTDTLENLCYSYGYYFGTVSVDPIDFNRVYIAGVPILMSEDGGKNFTFIGGHNVHADHHRIWANPDRPGHLINGNDGGVNISYDYGKSWIKCNTPAVGQFYSVNVSEGNNYSVYGGLQDNGTWKGPYWYKQNTSWHQTGQYPYEMLNGGDGMQVQIDEKDGYIYTGYQFGHYSRLNEGTGVHLMIHPRHELGEDPLRWNWQTPIWLSKHNNKVFYMGSNRFHRSLDRGESFKTLSGDLTKGGKKGDVSYGTLTSIHESPLEFGNIVVGSDDGLVHVSDDGGKTWTNVSQGLPKDMWVSRAIYSQHKKDRIFVTLNGYRWDYFDAMIFVSQNNGKSWLRIGEDIPAEPINVIREDPKTENILYVGSDNGAYVSGNAGKTFSVLGKGLPPVAVHDIAIQQELGHCVIGTHGRSIYRLDINGIQLMDTLSKEGVVLPVRARKHQASWGEQQFNWTFFEPEITFDYIINIEGYSPDSVEVIIVDKEDNVMYKLKQFSVFGHNKLIYNLNVEESIAKKQKLTRKDNGNYYLSPGTYSVRFTLRPDLVVSAEFEISSN